MRFALVSSEVSPFIGGGIAPMVRATAQLLAGAGHDVDVVTRGIYRAQAPLLARAGHHALAHPNIHWHWTPEPANNSLRWHEEAADGVDATLRRIYRRGRPDVVELQDYQGLGAMVAVDRASGTLADTPVAVRLNTSLEQVNALDGGRTDPSIAHLERIGLLAADLLLGPAPAVGDYYRDFYDELDLPPFVELWPGFLLDDAPVRGEARTHRGPQLDLLYLGRLQQLKGVAELVGGLVEQPDLNVRLTLVGADTQTGPERTSMRAHLEDLARDDPRITIRESVPRHAIGALLAAHDAVVMPSRWEAWGNVALEALAASRPVLVTPVSSLPSIAGNGRFGLVAAGHDQPAIAELLRRAVDERERLVALGGDPALREHLDELTDGSRVVRGYEVLAERAERTPRRPLAEWTRASGVTLPAVTPALQGVFADIYANETWTDKLPGMPRSGRGSLPEFSASVTEYLIAQIEAGEVASIADIGCGDLTFIRDIEAIRDGSVAYTGYDIVPALIAEHRELGWGEFHVADLTHDEFAVDADLILVKDVLFHLSNEDVARAIERLRRCSFKQLLITSLDVASNEPREFDRWHYAPLNLERPPFSLTGHLRSLPRELGSVHVYTRASLGW